MTTSWIRYTLLAAALVGAASPAALAQAAAAPAPPAAAPADRNEVRLFQRFIEDGAVTEGTWIEPQLRLQRFGGRDVYAFGPIVAVTVAEDIELGGRINLQTINLNPGGTETGFSDMEVYGKFRLTTKPSQISLGALLKFPTGETNKGLGTGEMDVAFFLGYRRDFKSVSFVGNAGLRINQDPDVPPLPSGRPAIEGSTSVQLGGAAIFPVASKSAGIIEGSYETERFNHQGADLRLTLGAQHRFTEALTGRAGVAWGFGDGAPNFEIIASGVFLF
ncbi:MAG: hypothetical protein HY049_03920 [Acidobacteria bacterium]|nr:hypothetical protein [Acidobacteriota bacterium]